MWQSAEKALAVIATIRQYRIVKEAKQNLDKALGLVPRKQDPRLTVAQLDRAVRVEGSIPSSGPRGFFKPLISQVEARTAVEMP